MTKKSEKIFLFFVATFKKSVFLQLTSVPNGVIGNTTDSGSVKSRFEPWLGNKMTAATQIKPRSCSGFFLFSLTF